MLNDYKPSQIKPVEEHEDVEDDEVHLECKNDTKLMWDCDNRHPGHGSTCSKQCPNGSGGVAERTCNCDRGSCSWEYRMPSIDCLNAITDHHRTAHKVTYHFVCIRFTVFTSETQDGKATREIGEAKETKAKDRVAESAKGETN